MRKRAGPDEETIDWRAVCGRTARPVRREGRVWKGLFSTPIEATDGKPYKHIPVFWMSAIPADITASLAIGTYYRR